MSNSLKDFILAEKTIEEIIADFKAQFPPFEDVDDEVIERYINQAFCMVPGGFVYCGFDCAYEAFLYGLAHLLTIFDVLNSTSLIPGIQRTVKSKTVDGLSISYEALNKSEGTPSNLGNYFSTTTYGLTLLSMLDTCGLTSSPGGFVV